MDGDLRRYLNALLALVSLNIGLTATQLIITSGGVSWSLFVIPTLIALIVGGLVREFSKPIVQ